MAKVSGSYASVTRGVSEQAKHERKAGQHNEQRNMISDPVRGTVRRHGSVMLDEKRIANFGTTAYTATLEDIKSYKAYTAFIAGEEYGLFIRTRAKVTNSTMPAVVCLNKATGTFLPVVRPAVDATLDLFESGGMGAFTNTGLYTFMAGNSITPTLSTVDAHGDTTNARRTTLWVRGGAYSRTFSVTFKLAAGTSTTVSYKTMPSSYQGVLDTSGVPAAATDYQKQVNDLTAAYNTAVTQHIGLAAQDIQPDSIAEKLRLAAAAAGITGTRIGSHVVFEHTATITEITVNDGGDNTLLRGVCAEVSSVDLLTPTHYVGKIVKVRPGADTEDVFYMQASPKVPGATGWAEVVWYEAAGAVQTPTTVFIYGTVHSGSFYMASSSTALTTLTGLSHPAFEASRCGDAVSAPPPAFFGKKINYLGMFQDRLIIGSGATLFMSRPGDYLNFFRKSVLTVTDEDPIEAFALGADDDVIYHGATYDKGLLLFGKRKQYSISGRQALTPKAPAPIVPMSAFEDATDAPPVQSGNLVFYSKPRTGLTSAASTAVYQIQIGVVADSPESYEVSQQLDRYISGTPAELAAVTAKPHTLFVRTEEAPTTIFVYRYIDAQAGFERLWDSWSKWDWNPVLGECAGITEYAGDLIVLTVRAGTDVDDVDKIYVCADRFTLNTSLSSLPYADSLRPLADFHTPPTDDEWLQVHNTDAIPSTIGAFDNTVDEYLIGTTGALMTDFLDSYGIDARDHMWAGITFEASFSPTNPYLRDRNDKAILDGRLTLNRFLFTLSQTGACRAVVRLPNGAESQALLFSGRIAGRSTSTLGLQPVVDTTVTAPVARETRECEVTLHAVGWLPCAVSALNWQGQFFNNTRRV